MAVAAILKRSRLASTQARAISASRRRRTSRNSPETQGLIYQRFHLIKLLQLPPQDEGRYVAANRYVALAHDLNISMSGMALPRMATGVLATSSSDKQDLWSMMRDSNCVAIGWGDASGLSTITNDKAGKDAIRDALLANDSAMKG